jgi:hypothetical protein
MLMRRRGITVHRRRYVVDRKHQMVFRRNMARSLHAVDKPQQRDDMAGSGLIDRSVEAG